MRRGGPATQERGAGPCLPPAGLPLGSPQPSGGARGRPRPRLAGGRVGSRAPSHGGVSWEASLPPAVWDPARRVRRCALGLDGRRGARGPGPDGASGGLTADPPGRLSPVSSRVTGRAVLSRALGAAGSVTGALSAWRGPFTRFFTDSEDSDVNLPTYLLGDVTTQWKSQREGDSQRCGRGLTPVVTPAAFSLPRCGFSVCEAPGGSCSRPGLHTRGIFNAFNVQL